MSEKKTSPEQLVSLLRELQFDDTFREVNAVMRFDAKILDNDVVTQLLIDFRHKVNPRKSKPRDYLTMSSTDQHLNLLTAATAMAVFHNHRKTLAMTPEDIEHSVRSVTELVKSDAISLVQELMAAVQKRKSELAYKQEKL